MINETLERKIIELVATDRIAIPIKSMAGKLDRARPKLAKYVIDDSNFQQSYFGDRCYANVECEDKMKARGMRDGIEQFSKLYPKYGSILNEIIGETREDREIHLYFGMNPNSRITSDDYLGVMTNLGFTETESEKLYPRLMDISRKLSRKRDEDRSILVG